MVGMLIFTLILIAFFALSVWSDRREVVSTPDRPVVSPEGSRDGSSPGVGQAAQA
jgi:hypothetical protein